MALAISVRWRFVALVLLISMVEIAVRAQCTAGAEGERAVHELYVQKRWSELVIAARNLPFRSADVNFEYGMALAHLEQWPKARSAFLAGRTECRGQIRFPTELAGIAFEQKRYAEAAKWIRKAIRIDPEDRYVNELAGTVFLLLDNLDASLKYWNQIGRPEIADLETGSELRLQRLLIERAFVFSPHAQMKRADLLSSQARIEAMNLFPTYSLKLDARPGGTFNAEFHPIERDGFGTGKLSALVSIFSGVPYETVYPSYFNFRGTATNLESMLRWDAQKRRAWGSLSGPLHSLPQWRWTLAGDLRDENWAIRTSFTGAAPPLGSFSLKRETAEATLTSICSGRLQWTSGAEFSHRSYEDVMRGTVLNPELVSPGFELKHLASIKATLLDLPERRFMLTASASSEFARLWSTPPRLFEKGQGGVAMRWLPQAEGDAYEFTEQVRAGASLGSPPVDEMWMIGVERDNGLWLRAHVGTRDGRKGSSPLAGRYLLSNTDFLRTMWSNGLIAIKAGPWLDLARVAAPSAELAPSKFQFDAGAELKLTVLGTSVVLTYGHDLRSGNNAFYGSAVQR